MDSPYIDNNVFKAKLGLLYGIRKLAIICSKGKGKFGGPICYSCGSQFCWCIFLARPISFALEMSQSLVVFFSNIGVASRVQITLRLLWGSANKKRGGASQHNALIISDLILSGYDFQILQGNSQALCGG